MKPDPSIFRLFAELMAIVASAECVAIVLLPVIAPNLHGTAQSLLDVAILTLGAGPLLYWRMNTAIKRVKEITADLRTSEASARDALATVSAYRTALNQHAIIGVTDLSGRIIDANEPFCRISGHTREELIGADHSILNSGHHSKFFWAQMWKVVANGGIWRAEVCNKAKNGTLYWVDTTIAPVRDAEKKITGFIAVRLDITARKLDEEKLSKAIQAADAANRAKSEFLANMSHEIRTPLTAILGYADLLRDDGGTAASSEQRSQALNTIQTAGQHLLTVINDILDLSKLDADSMRVESIEIPLVRVLREVEGLMRPRAVNKGVSLNVAMATPVPDRIITDPTRLRQILFNLLGNAVKFTDTGRITITVSVIESAAPARLVIDIEDTGAGMTEQQASRVFAPFSQGDTTVTRKHGGSGLGLIISRRLGNLMGGDVKLIRTEPGKGSCFRLVLPLRTVAGSEMVTSMDSASTSGPGEVKAPLIARGTLKGRILLAEDGPDNQRLIALHLRSAGAEVTIAENGQIAMTLLTQAAGTKPYDLLLTDMQMPEMDGYTLARQLRGSGSTLAIVALTAHAMDEDRAKCLAAGCDDYATKPIDRTKLVAVCAAWIGRQGGVTRPERAVVHPT